jgi:hypothetical protein
MTSEEIKQFKQLLGSIIRPPAPPDPPDATAHAAHATIRDDVKKHGVAPIARRLGICKETLLSYIAERCHTGTRELIERRLDRLLEK